jgi:hypothetical protein
VEPLRPSDTLKPESLPLPDPRKPHETRAWELLSLLQELDRAFQHLVLAFPEALDRWFDFDVRLQADALELSAVGVANVVPPEPHGESAGKDGDRDIAVGARRVTADEGRAASRLQKQAGVFGLADGAFVDQQDRLALVFPPVGRCCPVPNAGVRLDTFRCPLSSPRPAGSNEL